MSAMMNADKVPLLDIAFPALDDDDNNNNNNNESGYWRSLSYLSVEGKTYSVKVTHDAASRLSIQNEPGNGEEGNFVSCLLDRAFGRKFQNSALGKTAGNEVSKFERLCPNDSQLLFTGKSWHVVLVLSDGGNSTATHD
jgi:hypothetical protein